MATTDGFTTAPTSAILGSCVAVPLAAGGVHEVLVDVMVFVGVVVSGLVMLTQPARSVTPSVKTIIITKKSVFKFSFFIYLIPILRLYHNDKLLKYCEKRGS